MELAKYTCLSCESLFQKYSIFWTCEILSQILWAMAITLPRINDPSFISSTKVEMALSRINGKSTAKLQTTVQQMILGKSKIVLKNKLNPN